LGERNWFTLILVDENQDKGAETLGGGDEAS
jgi:hypothetical protein